MADYDRANRIEVYHMIEDANLSTTGKNESNRTEKIPQVLADFHACIDKLTELQGTGKTFAELSPKEQAEAFIASTSVNYIISKVEDSLTTDKLSHQEIIAHCGVTEIYEQTLEHFDPVAHPEAVRENPFIEDRAAERIDHFYTDYNHQENDTIGVENYSCYLLPGEENPVDPDDPFRTETNPDYHSFLMDSNEEKLERYRAYTTGEVPDRVDLPVPEEHTDREPPAPDRIPDAAEPEARVSADRPESGPDPEIFRFLSSAVSFPLEVLNSREAADYVAGARGEKGLQEFEAAKSGLISAVREGNMEGVSKCAHAIQHQLDMCERKTGAPLEIASLRSDRYDRLADLGERAFTGSDGKLIRLNQTDPFRAWAVLKFDLAVLTTSKEDWEAKYHTEKPSAAGAAGRCVTGFLGLMNSLSGTGLFTAYSNAVFKGLLDYADRVEREPDRGLETGREPDSAPVSIEAVAKYSAMEITNLLERPDSPEIQSLRDALGEDRFSEFQTEIREYLDTNDSSHWEKAQEILENAADRPPADVERRPADTDTDRTTDPDARRDRDSSAGPEKFIVRLRDIDAHQNRHGEFTSLFSFDSNGNEYRTTGMRRLDPRDTVESFKFMTSVISAYAHGGKMDFQLPGRDMHLGKAVGIKDIFMSVNHFLHSDIGYTIIKYAFEHAKDAFMDIRAAETRDLFEEIVDSIENGPDGGPPDLFSREDIQPEPPTGPDSPLPGDPAARRDDTDTDDLIAASEDTTESSPPEETPHTDVSSPVSTEESGSAPPETDTVPAETSPDPDTSIADTSEPSQDVAAELHAPPDTAVPEEAPAVSVSEPAPADYTQVSTEAKDAIAAYLDPDQNGTQTYEEIFESLMEKYPDVDYNHIDFAMDTAEVFSANAENGISYGEDTAQGLFDNMYELIMNNEPVNDGFSREDLYDMTFREIVSDTGEPVCREDLFIRSDPEPASGGNPEEPVKADEIDLSGTAPLQDPPEAESPAAELPLEIQTDAEMVPGVGESAPGDLTEDYASALQDADLTGTEESLPVTDAALSVPEADASLPDSIQETDFAGDHIDVPEETKFTDMEMPVTTEIPDAADTIPEAEVQIAEDTAEAVMESGGAEEAAALEEAAETEEIVAALL